MVQMPHITGQASCIKLTVSLSSALQLATENKVPQKVDSFMWLHTPGTYGVATVVVVDTGLAVVADGPGASVICSCVVCGTISGVSLAVSVGRGVARALLEVAIMPVVLKGTDPDPDPVVSSGTHPFGTARTKIRPCISRNPSAPRWVLCNPSVSNVCDHVLPGSIWFAMTSPRRILFFRRSGDFLTLDHFLYRAKSRARMEGA